MDIAMLVWEEGGSAGERLPALRKAGNLISGPPASLPAETGVCLFLPTYPLLAASSIAAILAAVTIRCFD
jgi:hypothetical protein